MSAGIPEVTVWGKDEPEILFLNKGGKRILLMHDVARFAQLNKKVKVDILILSGRKYVDVSKLQRSFEIKKVVLSSGLKVWIRKKTISELEKIKIPYFDVNTCGAWICCSH